MPVQQLDVQDSNWALCDLIAQHIASSPQQRITFAEYMDWVLYHPQHGYYATHAVNIGFQGDFFTSPHLGPDFGELLAEQFLEMWHILGKPVPFTLVEMGAGQGLLAADLLRYLERTQPHFFAALEYVIVEKSAALIAEQQRQLADFMTSEYDSVEGHHLGPWKRVRWCTWDEIAIASITGCFFSNELVDAFSVHQVTILDGQLQEIYVTTADSADQIQFVEVNGNPSTEQLTKYFELVGIAFPSAQYSEGYRSEVNLAALNWLNTVSDRLHRGYLLTIDYGHTAERYYNPRRQAGTLQCYYRHTRHDNPYVHIGCQDLTAHVDFTALERQGDRCGLKKIGFVPQELFLMALGLGDRMAALSNPDAPPNRQELQNLLKRRESLHSLINPMGLGNFGVLVQSKGLSETEQSQPLKGIHLPFTKLV